MRAVDAGRIEQAGDPFAARKTLQVGSGDLVLGLAAESVVAVVAVTACAVFGEELGALRECVVAQEGDGAGGRDAVRRLGEHDHACGVALGGLDGENKLGAGGVFGAGEVGQETDAGEHGPKETEVEAVAEFPFADEGHGDEHAHEQRRDDDRAPDFRAAGKIFQQLEEEEEIPLGPRGGELFGGIGRCAELGAAVADDEEDDDEEHGEAGDGVAQHLVGPEGGVGPAAGLLGREPVATEQINMRDDEGDDYTGDDARVQGEEAREGVVAVVAATDDQFLELGPDERRDGGDARGDLGGPESLLIPRQQVTGEREREHEEQ